MTPRPRISVIIPTLKDGPTLRHLLAQLDATDVFEIIVIQSHQNPMPPDTKIAWKWLQAPQGRGPQIQKGLDIARCEIVWILHADSRLPADAISEIKRISALPKFSLGCFPLKFNHSNISLALFEQISRLPTALTTFGDQGYFFKRADLIHIGDLSAFPLLEDVALYRALNRRGRVIKSRQQIITDAARFLTYGIWLTQWRNFKILWRFYRGTSPKTLYAEYYSETSDHKPISSATSLSGL